MIPTPSAGQARATTRRPLGRTGLTVSQAGFGGGGLGNFYRIVTDADARAVADAAWDAGIRYFDTAPFYGRGRGERRLGAALDGRPRDEFVLSTKVGRILEPARGHLVEDGIFLDPAPFNPVYDYSYDGVMRSHESSLQRLGLDRIDLLLVHDIGAMLHGDDADARLEELKAGGLKALEALRSQGVIRGYGLGVNEVEACVECLDYGAPDAFLLAGRFTLLEQTAAAPLLDRCLREEVSLIVGGVFNSGVLATGAAVGARYNYAPAPSDILDRVRCLEAICRAHGVSLAATALQFPLMHPATATLLLGVGTRASLERSLDGLEAVIPQAFWRDLFVQGLLQADPDRFV